MREGVELGCREQVVVEEGGGEGRVWEAGRDGEEGVEFGGEVGEAAGEEGVGGWGLGFLGGEHLGVGLEDFFFFFLV